MILKVSIITNKDNSSILDTLFRDTNFLNTILQNNQVYNILKGYLDYIELVKKEILKTFIYNIILINITNNFKNQLYKEYSQDRYQNKVLNLLTSNNKDLVNNTLNSIRRLRVSFILYKKLLYYINSKDYLCLYIPILLE